VSEPFIAEIRIFAGNFAPRGWASCDGQLLSISQNTALFSLVGTTYGGDGRTNFALPNLQGRAPMHPGRGPGLATRRLGERIGAAEVTLTEAQLPPHTHTIDGVQASASPADTNDPTNAYFARTTGTIYGTPGGSSTSNLVGGVGSSNPHNNMQPYLGINFIIALQGLYPSR